MSRWTGLWLALSVSVLLSGCAGGVPARTAPEPGTNPGLAARQAVLVDGQTWDVGQLTESTWSAIARPSSGTPGGVSADPRSALLKEIERASKCRVASSEYSREGRQLDAQVDCARRLQN